VKNENLIADELQYAGICVHTITGSNPRNKPTIIGRLNNWTFVRTEQGWLAYTEKGCGIPKRIFLPLCIHCSKQLFKPQKNGVPTSETIDYVEICSKRALRFFARILAKETHKH
jgi:hypothetical protein